MRSQNGPCSYYSRLERDYRADLATIERDDLLRRARPFGTRSQGVHCVIDKGAVGIFDAGPVTRPHLQQSFAMELSAQSQRFVMACYSRRTSGRVKIKNYRAVD